MNPYSIFENLNAEDIIDSRVLSLIIDDNQNINKKLQADFDCQIRDLNYKNFIYYYNRNLDLNNVHFTKEGALHDVVNLVNEIEYSPPIRESDYLKNISDLLALKHFLNSLEKTKSLIQSKIHKFKEKVLSESNQKYLYNEQTKTIFNEIFTTCENKTEEEFMAINNPLRYKMRPETAKPKVRNNSSLIDDKKTFMSFDGKSSPRFNFKNHPEISTQSLKNNESNRGGMNINLTSCVWPKSRTLLSIISKMYSEKYITCDQRTILKEMIIDRDKTITMHLNEYEVSGDSIKLYQNIIKLADNRLNNRSE